MLLLLWQGGSDSVHWRGSSQAGMQQAHANDSCNAGNFDARRFGLEGVARGQWSRCLERGEAVGQSLLVIGCEYMSRIKDWIMQRAMRGALVCLVC